MSASAHRIRRRRAPLLSKVPEITVYFWIIKVLTTAMGEATSDYLVYHMNPYLAVVLGGLVFVAALAVQFAAERYVAWKYWLAVTMVAVFGTMVADATHVVLGVPYADSSAVFALLVAIVFIVWHRVEGTLSIHSIRTRRREFFYWATVVAAFALGTALGDMTAMTLRLGFLASAGLFAVLFALPLFGGRYLRWNDVFAFWFAYVVTRPLGASCADWFGMSPVVGGLGINKALVSGVLTVFIVAFVYFISRRRIDIQQEPARDADEQDSLSQA